MEQMERHCLQTNNILGERDKDRNAYEKDTALMTD